MKKSLLLLLLLSSLRLIAGCGSANSAPLPPSPLPHVASLAVVPQFIFLTVGGTEQLSASATLSDGSTPAPPSACWSSSDAKIVNVSPQGRPPRSQRAQPQSLAPMKVSRLRPLSPCSPHFLPAFFNPGPSCSSRIPWVQMWCAWEWIPASALPSVCSRSTALMSSPKPATAAISSALASSMEMILGTTTAAAVHCTTVGTPLSAATNIVTGARCLPRASSATRST